jgi:hypothetical protein
VDLANVVDGRVPTPVESVWLLVGESSLVSARQVSIIVALDYSTADCQSSRVPSRSFMLTGLPDPILPLYMA